ncbi:MAG TPA: invasin domain 3-containing protein [bacterium]|nr:invasin domain 3-containing protein [bacterium]
MRANRVVGKKREWRAREAAFIAAIILLTVATAASRAAVAADALAMLEKVEGKTLIRHEGESIWRAAAEGESIQPGDSVKTLSNATALAVFAKGGAVDILPMTEVVFDLVEKNGLTSIAMSLEAGRALLRAEDEEGAAQFVIKAGNAAFRARNASVFVEVKEDGGCVDVLSGDAYLTSTLDSAIKFPLVHGQRAIGFYADDSMEMFEANIADFEMLTHSCMPERKQDEARQTAQTEGGSSSGAEERPEISSLAPIQAASYPEDDANADGEEPAEEEYEISVSTTVTMQFAVSEAKTEAKSEAAAAPTALETVAEEQPVCATLPRIIRVSANETSILPGSRPSLDFYECGPMQVMFIGTAEDGCGPIEKVMIKIEDEDEETYQADGKKSWSYTAAVEKAGTWPIKIWAVDETGAVSAGFEFRMEMEKNVEPPNVSLQTIANRQAPSFGGRMKLNKSRLTNGRMSIEGTADSPRCDISRVDVSVNDGTAWNRANGGGVWSYSFVPRDGTYEIVARAADDDGQESAVTATVEVQYIDKTDEELLRIDFDALMAAYRDKNAGGFIDGVSSRYSSPVNTIEDLSRLDYSLNTKFMEQSTVYIRYLVVSTTVSGNTGRVMFNWDTDRRTAGYTHTGTFVFDLDDEGWRLLTVSDADTFLRHTDEAAYISVRASEAQLKANRADTATIYLEVRDSAYNPVKDGTMITLLASSGEVDAVATTSEGLAEATYTTGSSAGTAVITARRGSAAGTASIVIVEESPPGPPEEPGG